MILAWLCRFKCKSEIFVIMLTVRFEFLVSSSQLENNEIDKIPMFIISKWSEAQPLFSTHCEVWISSSTLS